MHDILDSMLNYQKIKYTVLDELFSQYTRDEYSGGEAAIFIDLNSVLSSFYKNNAEEHFIGLDVNDKYIFCSQILNIAAHFRHYFFSRKYMYSTIYFMYSTKQPKYPKFIIPEYKKEFMGKYDKNHPKFFKVNEVIAKNLEVVELISKYLPHVYFINSESIDPYVVPYHFAKLHHKSPKKQLNIIYSNNKQFLNYPAIYDNFVTLSHKSDKSTVKSSENVMESLLTKKHIEEGFEIPCESEFFHAIQSVSGIKDIGLDGIKGYGNIKILKTLAKQEERITRDSFLEFDNDEELVKNSMDILDFEKHYIKAVFENNNDTFLNQQRIDLIDGDSIVYINHRYLNHYPIYLEYLFEGEEYE